MTAPLLVCAGGLRADYLITREGEAHNRLPGGNALFSAAGARLWTDHVGLWARCGRNYPDQWLAALARMGLHTHGLIRLPDDQDHRTFFAYTPDGRRDDTQPAAHFARIGQDLPEDLAGYVHSTPQQDDPQRFEPLALRPEDWPAAYDETTAVQLSPQPLATHLSAPATLRAAGVRLIGVDPGERYMIPERSPYIRELLPQVEAFMPSDQEVRSLFGEGVDLWAAAEQLQAWGASLVVVKIGAEGILLLEQENGRRAHLPAYHEPGDSRVVDVTGAGDAFCGGFMAGLALSGDALLSAQMGVVSASLVIEGYGALFALALARKTAVQRLEELQQRG